MKIGKYEDILKDVLNEQIILPMLGAAILMILGSILLFLFGIDISPFSNYIMSDFWLSLGSY